MGKGIALRFKQIYPDMFKQYRSHCESQRLTIGKLFLFKTRHKWVLNFPTKEHWRSPSRPEYIEAGLKKFRDFFFKIGAESYSFPMLGCGNGELNFETQVRPMMEKYLANLSVSTRIHIGHNHIGPPEHSEAEHIKKWLQSDPAALPFYEVWDDLVQVLQHQNNFNTQQKKTFSVYTKESPRTLIITRSDNRCIQIVEEELTDFWHQLRGHGLSYYAIAPNHRHLSYLIPVFEKLSYVQTVAVSQSASRLYRNPSRALQVIPPSTHDYQEPNLFGRSRIAVAQG